MFSWFIGQRIEWRVGGRLVRFWWWITKQNIRVVALDFETGELVLERCR